MIQVSGMVTTFKMNAAEGILLIFLTTLGLCQGLFVPDQQYVYHYHAVVQVGTLTPANAVSEWKLRGKLSVQAHQGSVTMQLGKLTVSMYNGGTPDTNIPSKLAYHTLPPETSDLMLPFKVNYVGNKVKDIYASSNEHDWSLNMKRGLASLFQLEESQFHLPAFITQENTLYGECHTEYVITRDGDKTTVRKFLDITDGRCKGNARYSWSNAFPLFCSRSPPTITSTTGRVYVLTSLRSGFLNLESIESHSETDIQPFHAQGEMQYAFVNQSLRLESRQNIAETLHMPENVKSAVLMYSIPSPYISQHSILTDVKYNIKMIDTLLGRLYNSLDVNPMQAETHQLHNEFVPHLLYFLSILDKSHLEQYYAGLAIGTSYRQETIRHLFLNILPQVGSSESILFIHDLVLHGKVKGTTAMEMLSVFPFYMRETNEKLLKECESLLAPGDEVEQDVKHAAVLAFSIFVYKTCLQSCQTETLEKYVHHFVDLFAGSTTYEDQLLYLEALNNIELGNVYDYIEPIIRGNVTTLTKQPHHIRFLGVWATMTAAYNPSKTLQIYQTYWPILTNCTEHLEMRVAALTMLMLSQSTYGNFFNLFWFMKAEPNIHLQHFFYTTLESLIDSKYPCYLELSNVASHIIRYMKPPQNRNWATGNYILDYSDTKYGFGGLAQLFAVANQRTGNPNVFYLMLNNHALGHSTRQVAMYLKLEGVGDAIKPLLVNINTESLKMSHLTNILQDLKAPVVTSEPIHIEIIMKVEGKVILCHYINETTFHKYTKAFTQLNIISRKFHVNYQSINAPFIKEVTQPTDVGTPLMLSIDSSILTSIRGNLTTEANSFTQRNHIEFRYSLSAGGSLILYNPILDLWHRARRSITYQNYFPISNNIILVPALWQLKFSLNQPVDAVSGVVGHVQTSVSIQGKDSALKLKQFCSSCQNYIVVTANTKGTDYHGLLNETVKDLGYNFQVSLFDCEHPHFSDHHIKIIREMLSDENRNYRVMPISRPLLGFIHALDRLMLVPPHGNCGLRAQIASTSEEETEIEGILQFTVNVTTPEIPNEMKHMFRLSLAHKSIRTRTALQAWTVNLSYNHAVDNTRHSLRIRVIRTSGAKQTHRLCFDAEAIFPKSDDGVLLPWDPTEPATAKANLVWGETDGKCPKDGSEITVLVQAEVTEEQRNLASKANIWPYGACAGDSKNTAEWGEGYTPITEACYQASLELATLRKYSATVKYKNIPSGVVSLTKRLAALLELIEPGIASDIPNTNLIISLEVPVSRPGVKLLVNKHQFSMDHARSWLEPFLINTRFTSSVPLAMKFGVIGSCVVNSAHVITLDNSTNSFSPSACYTLVAADCTSEPKFAVFVKKTAEPNFLAVKIYTGGNFVEIIPTQGKLEAFGNSQKLQLEHDYYYPSNDNIYDFRVHQVREDLMQVTSKVSGVWLQHNGHFLVLVVPLHYRGQACGLCGDFNGDQNNDISPLLTAQCEQK